jgi:hypothetical protein
MKSNKLVSATVLLLVGTACLSISRSTSADVVKDIGNTAVKKVFPGFGSPWGRHENVPPFMVKQKPVYILGMLPVDESRFTNNFSVKDADKGEYTCYVINVPRTQLLGMRFQRKGDKKGKPDTNRVASFRSGEKTVLDGDFNYLAARDFKPATILKESPSAMIVFLPGGVTLDDVLDAMQPLPDKDDKK